MLRVLDQGGGGWLTNFSIDAYMSTLMPSVGKAKPGDPRLFLPSWHSHTIVLGFITETEEGERDEQRTAEQRATAAAKLKAADEIYINYNINIKHWALVRLLPGQQQCEVFDSTGIASAAHARRLLSAYEELTGVNTKRIVSHGLKYSGSPSLDLMTMTGMS